LDAAKAELTAAKRLAAEFADYDLVDRFAGCCVECARDTDLPIPQIVGELARVAGITARQLRASASHNGARWKRLFREMQAERQLLEDRRAKAARLALEPPEGLVYRQGGARLLADPFAKPARPPGPTPFEWTDPDNLPRREWLYSTILIRKEVSATLAPGGVGKTSLMIAEALAMVSGKPLLGVTPPTRMKVWLWNGEEPFEEMQRRIMAACRHFGLARADIEGRLFVDTAETLPLVLAEETRDGTIINRPIVDQLSTWLIEREIDALFVDPFISTHNVNENDNNAIQKATTAWKEVAQKANVAIGAAHHTRKVQGGREATAEDSRGAKAFTDKCRVARSLNPMSKEEAERFGVEQAARRSYFSFDPTEMKANMSPATGGKTWFKTTSVVLGKGRRGNVDPGDSVAVVEDWKPPSPQALAGLTSEQIAAVQAEVASGEHRADERSPHWVGNAVTRALGLDVEPGTKKRVKAIIERLLAEGHLKLIERPDAARKLRAFVEVGDAAKG
jgi:hypothetical protein